MGDFAAFFKRATGEEPFPYQMRLAARQDTLSLLQAPTGSGKTAATVLAWLWRRRFVGEDVRAQTPRRLVYCLPMRVLVEQTRDAVEGWLQRLAIPSVDWNATQTTPQPRRGAGDAVAVAVLMGGERVADWDLAPELDTVIIGTQDMLLSRALNRGYAMSRYRWPLAFGLLNNDVLWVYDEIQLMGDALATSAQLAGLRRKYGSLGQTQELWMSATAHPDWLRTPDLVTSGAELAVMELGDDDHAQPELARRLNAPKTLSMLPDLAVRDLAREVLVRHFDGELTLVVVNTVKRALDLYAELKKAVSRNGARSDTGERATEAPELVLLHSRFRPPDRRQAVQRLLAPRPPVGRVVVSTQVVEAGIDISAATLVTDLAPWPSLVQRLGRCNRYGEHDAAHAVVVNLDTTNKGRALPYTVDELDVARGLLEGLGEDADVAPAHLSQALVDRAHTELAQQAHRYVPRHVLRRCDFIDLFDTIPDLAGNDLDVSRFIRQADESDAHVFWRVLEGDAVDRSFPHPDELCPVPVDELRKFIDAGREAGRRASVRMWDPLRPTDDNVQGDWVPVETRDVRPGEVYLIEAAAGGYDAETGWQPQKRADVAPVIVGDLPALPAGGPIEADADSSDPYLYAEWQTIAEHTDAVLAELERLLAALALPGLDHDLVEALRLAARWHDRGKAHPVFQQALLGRQALREPPRADGLWAKSPVTGTARYARRGFRHELASALAAREAGLSDLAWYLAGAHHGKVRVALRALPEETAPSGPDGRDDRRFARGIWDGDELPATPLGGGIVAPPVRLSLSCMDLGLGDDGQSSWTEAALRLRDSHPGPLRLVFLEALLRIADQRASRAAGDTCRTGTKATHAGGPDTRGEWP